MKIQLIDYLITNGNLPTSQEHFEYASKMTLRELTKNNDKNHYLYRPLIAYKEYRTKVINDSIDKELDKLSRDSDFRKSGLESWVFFNKKEAIKTIKITLKKQINLFEKQYV